MNAQTPVASPSPVHIAGTLMRRVIWTTSQHAGLRFEAVRTAFAKEGHITVPAGTIGQVHLRAPLYRP